MTFYLCGLYLLFSINDYCRLHRAHTVHIRQLKNQEDNMTTACTCSNWFHDFIFCVHSAWACSYKTLTNCLKASNYFKSSLATQFPLSQLLKMEKFALCLLTEKVWKFSLSH